MNRLIIFSFFPLFLCLLLFYGCSERLEERIRQLTFVKEVEELSNGTFFSDVRGMFATDSLIVFSDYKNNHIFLLDKQLQWRATIGGRGAGPGELLGASRLFTNERLVFVEDEEQQRVQVFNCSGAHKNVILYGHRPHSGMRFFEKEGFLYYSIYSDAHTICRHDIALKKNTLYGAATPYKTSKETRVKNGRHLLRWKNRIIAVRETDPVIEMYDFSGKLRHSFNFSALQRTKDFTAFVAGQSVVDNGFYVCNPDAYVAGDALYVLTAGVEEQNHLV